MTKTVFIFLQRPTHESDKNLLFLMNNLFSIFDPQARIPLIYNWCRALTALLLIMPQYWKITNQSNSVINKIILTLHEEIKLTLGRLPSPGVTHVLTSLFLFIIINNFLGLISYIFTATSHLRFTLSLTVIIWTRTIAVSAIKDLNHLLAHLVPVGTPYALMPLIVLIELVRRLIRPVTLSVRLAANMVAGHLLLVLISGPAARSSLILFLVILIRVVLIIILESAVALIQAYVFITLNSLYINDVNTPNVN